MNFGIIPIPILNDAIEFFQRLVFITLMSNKLTRDPPLNSKPQFKMGIGISAKRLKVSKFLTA
jgi:hypothetical protein